MNRPPSIVVYRGPSALDPSTQIRGILTFGSSNTKTGDMAQLWILNDLEDPSVASRAGHDSAVCGDCPQRRSLGGGCYVTLFQAPVSVWRASQGKPASGWSAYTALRSYGASRQGAVLRLGAYGDPAALPEHVVRNLVQAVNGRHTGYTHGWRNPVALWLKRYVMASAESARDALIARSQGWRTFRITSAVEQGAHEILCVAESRSKTCQECGLCNGSGPDNKRARVASITIPAHGAMSGRALATA